MGPSVCVGVCVHADPARLLDTVRYLRLHTDPRVHVMVLPDGADIPTLQALQATPELARLPRWGTPDARGTPACFNRLATGSDADVLVLLESGALVAPGWLDLLLSALDTPGCGLAGPSTNLAWNEQAAFADARGGLVDIRSDAARALARFGPATRRLDPLYSLGDFCYAVRREVVATIGAADEAYGLGPCWEMDYNVRAERAGIHGLWAQGAYVFRSPLTDRRTTEEESRRETSRRLYQDRFCGLRLRGERRAYEPHCRGDRCEHFAPTELLRLHRPLRTAAPAAAPVVRATTSAPLVSAVMPTRGRSRFAIQAVRYFLSQDYPNTELVIVEDGPPALAASLPQDARLRLVSSGAQRSIGVMRNDACALALGEVVVLWDDDDWHGPTRISAQVSPILAGAADLTGLRDVRLFDIDSWQAWLWTPELHARMLALDVLSGTIAFRRSVWETVARYPDTSLAEDAVFVQEAVRGGARLQPVDGTDLYVYVRHGRNSWQLDHGEPGRDGWLRVDPPNLSAVDRAFYSAYSALSAYGRAENTA